MISCTIESLDALPLIAILRGLTPDKAVEVGEAILEAGFVCLEVPLNSPEPLESIRRLRQALDGRALVGAGTVLTPEAVEHVAEAGGQLCISPNTDVEVIRSTKARGMLSMPGFFTPSEAFQALAAGADALKMFPAEIAGPKGLKAVRAVLPAAARVYVVGGVNSEDAIGWRAAGASGFGLGSALFRPEYSLEAIRQNATAFVSAWKASTET